MELIKATESDLQELYSLYRRTTESMKQDGLNQWIWGIYPTEEMIREDVERGELYIARTDGVLTAAIMLTETPDPGYEGVSWTGGVHPGFFHRLAVDPPQRGTGIGADVLDDAIQILRDGADVSTLPIAFAKDLWKCDKVVLFSCQSGHGFSKKTVIDSPRGWAC